MNFKICYGLMLRGLIAFGLNKPQHHLIFMAQNV